MCHAADGQFASDLHAGAKAFRSFGSPLAIRQQTLMSCRWFQQPSCARGARRCCASSPAPAFGAAAVRGAYPRLGTPWPLPRHSCIFISIQSSAVLSFYGNCVLGPTLKILTVPTASCPPALYAEFCCVSHSLPRTPTNPSPPLPSTIIV